MDRFHSTIHHSLRDHGRPVYPHSSHNETAARDDVRTTANQESHNGRTGCINYDHRRMDTKSYQLHVEQVWHCGSKQLISLLPHYAVTRQQLLESHSLWYLQFTVSKGVHEALHEGIPFGETAVIKHRRSSESRNNNR